MNKTILEDVYSNCACYRARAAARRVTRDYDDALKPLGLKITQFTVLATIKGHKPSSTSKLANGLAMERTSLVRTLELMQTKGWVRLGPEGYRREQQMELTAKGEALLEKALPVWREVQTRFENRVGKERWDENKDWLLDVAFGDD
ncbi:MarR family winged helix-turn-helix transcriptional regulator [Pseudohongiella sp. O18]|uniref:MarR family winged helix-turn-helix transcriptional regulator n=1 Tax=Pseudohongiella sp. O18 TaxID=2904248 RepID=UPI001F361BE9|nr:MarR family winged helix-turn-helix transcriptional regulator [Pseudohongiella sp. O18]